MLPHLINADLDDLTISVRGHDLVLQREEFATACAVLRFAAVAEMTVGELREFLEVVRLGDRRLRALND